MLATLRRPARFAAGRLGLAGNRMLDVLERRVSDGSAEPLPHPPIFVIGAPRCGSTVLHQALITRFELGYIANVHHVFYGSPAAAEFVLNTRRWRRQQQTFESYHGRTQGLLAPHEAEAFWYRFFRRHPHHVRLEDADPRALAALRGAVRALTRAFDAPVAFKNLYSSVRIEPLVHALPEALFLVLRRDEADNAHSLLESRLQLRGDARWWFSLEPPEVARLRTLPPEAQVVEQIRAIHRFIDQQRALVGTQRFLDLEYERFCRQPSATLDEVADFCLHHGTRLRTRGPLPDSFEMRREVRIPAELLAALRNYLATGKQGGPAG